MTQNHKELRAREASNEHARRGPHTVHPACNMSAYMSPKGWQSIIESL